MPVRMAVAERHGFKPRCLIPWFNGVILSLAWKDPLSGSDLCNRAKLDYSKHAPIGHHSTVAPSDPAENKRVPSVANLNSHQTFESHCVRCVVSRTIGMVWLVKKNTSRLAEIYTSERSRLRRIAARILGNWDDADDVTQEAYARLQQGNIEPRGAGIFVSAIRTIALDRLRATKIRQSYVEQEKALDDRNSSPTPEAIASARQELDDLLRALESLPRRQQQIFLLNRLDGMRHAEIAKQLGVSVSTVEKELNSALDFCRRWRERREHE